MSIAHSGISKWRVLSAALAILVGQGAQAELRLTAQAAYVPAIRYISASSQADYYDGFGFGGMLSIVKPNTDFYASYVYSAQKANYTDIDPGPTESVDQYLGVGVKKYLATGRRAFIQIGGAALLSDTFDSPKFGASIGGGLSWMLGKRLSLGTTTLFSMFPYSGFHRRYLHQSLDFGFSF